MDSNQAWFWWAVLSAIFAALTAIFAKLGIQGINSDFATLIRTVIILILLLAFTWATGRLQSFASISSRSWLFLALSAVATGGSWVCYFRALQQGQASKVAPIDKLSLVLVAIFAFAFLHERPSLREWAGILLVASGVVVLAFKH